MNHFCRRRSRLDRLCGANVKFKGGIFYQLKNGCNWCDLPRDLPPYSTVFWYYKQWRDTGVLDEIMDKLHGLCTRTSPKKPKWTTLIMIDSQAVKNTCNASIASKGFCHYKVTNGREFWGRYSVPKSLIIKRHLAYSLRWDFPFLLTVLKPMSLTTRDCSLMLSLNIAYFKAKPVNIPKITILVDQGYHPETITQALPVLYPQIMTKIRFECSPKPSKAEKEAQGKAGFVPVATLGVVERSNSWMERCKRKSEKL